MIEVKNLSKKFHDNVVLEDINLNIKQGDVVGVIGPSGTGKSTLLRCINQLERPEKGEIVLDGKKISLGKKNRKEIVELRKNTGMVFQRFNLFEKKYTINIEERITEQEVKIFQEKTKEIEEQAVHDAMRGMAIRTHHEERYYENGENAMPGVVASTEQYPAGEMPPLPEGPYNDADYAVPTDGLGYAPETVENSPEDENIIFGKQSRAKEKKLKIKELDANSGRVTLEGRVINSECRETKTGKGMLIFELYDGTGIITCKSFAEDGAKGNEILEKMKSAKAIKTIGKAGFDSFAGDITVMSNIIAEISDEGLPPLPEEDDSSPLILGSAPVIKEPLVKIADLNAESGSVCIDGEIQAMEDKETKSGKVILSIDIDNGSSTMTCKAFLP